MILQGIREEGSINIKAAFLMGEVKSGMVGVILVFVSMVVSVASLYFSYRENSRPGPPEPIQTIKWRKGDVELEWRGPLYKWPEAKHVESLLKNVAATLASHQEGGKDREGPRDGDGEEANA